MRLICLALALVACGPKSTTSTAATADPAPAPAEAAGESEKVEPAPVAATAPTPFTADEIREGCPAGRTILMRMTKEDEVSWQRTHFVGGDEITAEMEGAMWADGTDPDAADAIESTESWEVLRDHAAFPEDKTTITEGVDVSVPAGDFTTVRYDVIDDSGLVQHFFFAPELPGPPVKAVFEDATGQTVLQMVANEMPEDAPADGVDGEGGEKSTE